MSPSLSHDTVFKWEIGYIHENTAMFFVTTYAKSHSVVSHLRINSDIKIDTPFYN
jgi:hypothetical protein